MKNAKENLVPSVKGKTPIDPPTATKVTVLVRSTGTEPDEAFTVIIIEYPDGGVNPPEGVNLGYMEYNFVLRWNIDNGGHVTMNFGSLSEYFNPSYDTTGKFAYFIVTGGKLKYPEPSSNPSPTLYCTNNSVSYPVQLVYGELN